MRRSRIFRHWVAPAVLAAALAAAPAAMAAPGGLFGTREVRSNDLQPFQKWLGALDKYGADKIRMEEPCTPTGLERCKLQGWAKFLKAIARLDRRAQIDAVHRFINVYPYILDIVNWGVEDYWASPREMLEKSGDCEDYAIAKFLSLRLLGVVNDDMRIAVVQDLNLKALHAVLAVEMDGETVLLDNQSPVVVPAGRVFHYRPIYSLNETTWWRHRP